MRTFVDFAVADIARCGLLFQRPIPGFEPSPESYTEPGDVVAGQRSAAAAGMTIQDDIDCIVAMVAGSVEAQISNDPGGTRWTRHLDRLIDMYLDDAKRRRNR